LFGNAIPRAFRGRFTGKERIIVYPDIDLISFQIRCLIGGDISGMIIEPPPPKLL
jgi:hypothetical protein